MPTGNKESGMAIILAIGLSGLLLGIAATFVSNALLEKRSSLGYMEIAAARMAAQTAMERASASLKYASEADKPIAYIDLYPMNADMTDSEKEELKEQLITEIGSDPKRFVYLSARDVDLLVDSGNAAWEYILSNTDNPKKVARFSYVIVGSPIYGVDTPLYPNAFYGDDNQLFHRFNLGMRTDTDWNNLTVSDFLTEDILFDETSNTNTIKWLREFDNGIGTFADTEARRNQIIANLIDYCDSDTIPTGDSNTNPTYLGLENVPYINRVSFDIPVSITIDENWENFPFEFESTYRFTTGNITPKIQLVNMYDTEVSDLSVEMEYDVTLSSGSSKAKLPIEYAPSSSDNLEETLLIEDDFKETYFTFAFPEISYFLPDLPRTVEYTISDWWNTRIAYSVDTYIKLSINNLVVRLYQGGNLIDYSRIIDSSSSDTITILNGESSQITKTIYFETADPRQNHNHGDWRADTENIPDDNSNNPWFETSVDRGSEIDIDTERNGISPWEISTAVIKNAPMSNLNELGLIHRAESFRTLNLKRFNSDDSISYEYEKGDANILDHVKTSDYIYRTINTDEGIITNLNSRDLARLQELFYNYADNYSYEFLLNAVIDLVDTMLTELPPKLYSTRAELLSETGVIEQLTQKMEDGQEETDRANERYLGALEKSEALRFERFYVIAVGQSLKDMSHAPSFWKKNAEEPKIEVLGTQKIIAEVVREQQLDTSVGADPKPFKIIRMRYISD